MQIRKNKNFLNPLSTFEEQRAKKACLRKIIDFKELKKFKLFLKKN